MSLSVEPTEELLSEDLGELPTEDLDDAWKEETTANDGWDEGSLATLVGYNNSPATSSFAKVVSLDSDSHVAENASDNVMEQSELFDDATEDPVAGKTKLSFANNPWAKFLGAGIPLLGFFGLVGLFMSGVTSGKIKEAPSMAEQPTPTPSVVVTQPQVETGTLKTQVALAKQADQIKAIEEAKKPRVDATPTKNQDQDKSQAKQDKPGSDSKNSSGSARTPTRTASSPPPPPPRRAALQQRRYAPHPPIARSLPATAATVAPAKISERPAAKESSKPQVTEAEKVDPGEQWLALSKLGSYGNVEPVESKESKESESDTADTTSSNSLSASRAESTSSEETIYIVPRAIPVLTAANSFSFQTQPQEVDAPGGIVSPLLVAPVKSDTSDASVRVNYAEEANLINGIPIRSLQVGSSAQGQLVTPLVWSESSERNSSHQVQTAEADANKGQEFVVQLTESILDNLGQEALPIGTQIVFEAIAVADSGLVSLKAKRAIVDGQEYVLPSGAIAIRGKNGDPLIASKHGNKRDSILFADLRGMFFGALGRVGEVLTQPDSQSSTSVSGGGLSSSTTSQSGGKNIFGAILDGGFSPLSEQVQERNEERVEEIRALPDLWVVNAGKEVQVFVNQSFQL